ncbi:hypothetical protein [Brevifollis gellanilyticus]|uniref:Uncharacterized protein n=1 Tax=Brevifollis gellanilyticus TaxID=748831 RepID=A0A512M7K6_9BACT|nr:hypothetical protein [Brevifollis gellanilyticus]GEP42722.1 hypothetical protein BGE01nite_20130 [Brevifollis gellanilyticus]
MNVIQLTPDELAGLIAAAVAKALEGLLPRMPEVPVEVAMQSRSRKAVNQARYRQRLKERTLTAAHEPRKDEVHGVPDCDEHAQNPESVVTVAAVTNMATLATETVTSAATPVTRASALLATDVATSATSMATPATETATSVTSETSADKAPLPPAPFHPLPPQTPLSPAYPHPPTPGDGTRTHGGGDVVHFPADAGTITEAAQTQGQTPDQSQAQHLTASPGRGTCVVLTIARPNDMSGKGPGASVPAIVAGISSGSGHRPPQGRRRGRSDRPGRQRREKRPRDPEVLRLPRCEHALRLAAIFKRPATTEWSPNETKALRRTGKIEEEDLQVLEKYYAAHYPPAANRNLLRHDLVTLLNNLRGEVDRARRWEQKNSPSEAGGVKRGFFGQLMTPEYLEEQRKKDAWMFED